MKFRMAIGKGETRELAMIDRRRVIYSRRICKRSTRMTYKPSVI